MSRGKRSETADDRRKRIREAAFGIVKERGYAQATTLEIATRAKVSKRELYALFDDKQAIIASCIAERMRQVQMPLELPAVRDRDGLAQLLSAFGSMVLRVVSDSAVTTLFRVAVAEAERTPEIAAALDSIGRAGNRAVLAAALARAQQAGLLRKGSPELMAEHFFGLLWGDLRLGLLLGVAPPPRKAEIQRRTRDAALTFLSAYWGSA
ncbi:MAG TPA: TetR/AcrR family transcriptional regulator [Methylomirabilota bacterium]|nr:TetR/AcrR family transcriptional regulator [Methylomirabilota bacterium]